MVAMFFVGNMFTALAGLASYNNYTESLDAFKVFLDDNNNRFQSKCYRFNIRFFPLEEILPVEESFKSARTANLILNFIIWVLPAALCCFYICYTILSVGLAKP